MLSICVWNRRAEFGVMRPLCDVLPRSTATAENWKCDRREVWEMVGWKHRLGWSRQEGCISSFLKSTGADDAVDSVALRLECDIVTCM